MWLPPACTHCMSIIVDSAVSFGLYLTFSFYAVLFGDTLSAIWDDPESVLAARNFGFPDGSRGHTPHKAA